MQPKKAKDFIGPTAALLGLPVELVTDVINFYYQEVRKDLVNMAEPAIELRGLGTFNAKPKELPKLIMKYRNQVDSMDVPKTPGRIKIKLELERKLSNVQKLDRKIAAENKREYEFRTEKAKRSSSNMGKEKSDSGGD